MGKVCSLQQWLGQAVEPVRLTLPSWTHFSDRHQEIVLASHSSWEQRLIEDNSDVSLISSLCGGPQGKLAAASAPEPSC